MAINIFTETAPPMCPLHVWRGEWRQRRVFVLEIMSHTHGLTITNLLLLGIWNILTLTGKELELVEEAMRYQLDILGVSSTKRRGSGTVDLDADGNSSILVLILVCLHKRVWGFSQTPVCQTVCQIEFLWDHGSVC